MSLLGDNKPPYLSVSENHMGSLDFYSHLAETRCPFSVRMGGIIRDSVEVQNAYYGHEEALSLYVVSGGHVRSSNEALLFLPVKDKSVKA